MKSIRWVWVLTSAMALAGVWPADARGPASVRASVRASGAAADAPAAADPRPISGGTPLFPELERVVTARNAVRGQAVFVPPNAVEKRRFREAFALLVSEAGNPPPGAPSSPVRDAFGQAGFALEVLAVDRQPVWAVLEVRERPRGGGVFLVRPGPDAGVWRGAPGALPAGVVTRTVLMAPHPRSDRGTDLIGLRLFGLSRARAYLQTTVNRKVPAPDGSPSDAAHREDTYFQAAVEALDQTHPGQLFVQLHGFESTKHDQAFTGVDVVLSDARGLDRPAGIAATAIAHAKARHPDRRVAVWGAQVRELGGLTNAQGKLLNASGRSGFLHVEMALPVRMASVAAMAGVRPKDGEWARTLLEMLGAR